MYIKYFFLYVVLMGIIGLLRYYYIESSNSEKIVEKRAKIREGREELISTMYVECGGNKDEMRQWLENMMPYLIALCSWLVPVFIICEYFKGFFGGMKDE